MPRPITLRLSVDALYETARALADRGEDYGWDAYRHGSRAPGAADRQRMMADDDAAQGWIDAFDAALAAYESVAGEAWRY